MKKLLLSCLLIFTAHTTTCFAEHSNSTLNSTLAKLNSEIKFKIDNFSGYSFDSAQSQVTLHLRYIASLNDTAYYEGFVYDADELADGDWLSERAFFAAFNTTDGSNPKILLTLLTQGSDGAIGYSNKIDLYYETKIEIPVDLKGDDSIKNTQLNAVVYGKTPLLKDEDKVPYWVEYAPADLNDIKERLQKEIHDLKIKIDLPENEHSRGYILKEIHQKEKRLLQFNQGLHTIAPTLILKSELFANKESESIVHDRVATGPIDLWIGDGCEKGTIFLLKNESSKTGNINVVNLNFEEFFVHEDYDSEPVAIFKKLFIRDSEDTKLDGPAIPFTFVGPVTSYFQDLLEGYVWWEARKTGKLYLGRKPNENLEIVSLLRRVVMASKKAKIDDIQYINSKYDLLKFTFKSSTVSVLVNLKTGEVKAEN